MNNHNFSNSSALAALLHALLSAFYEAAIMTIIKLDAFLLPLWMTTIISIDKAIATTTGLFTSGVGPAFRLSTNFGKALRWLAEQLLPTTTTTTPEEESNITQETLDFLESRIRYLGNFFDATIASMTTTAKPPSSPKRDHSATSSFNNTSSTPVRHTPVRSQACSAQDYNVPDSEGPDFETMSVLSDFYPSDDDIDWLSEQIVASPATRARNDRRAARAAARRRASDLVLVGASGLSEAREEKMREEKAYLVWKRGYDERLARDMATRAVEKEKEEKRLKALEAHLEKQKQARLAPRGPRVIRDPISGRVFSN
ncbi:hypothetical protein GE21DRAFT_6324 [Neurospora crassa]|uniref:Uncharacterized protein n=1 Tax=Neurospora crassa (strain ATCC 24698 / 74-OR23-1A / CBS 708.71 / DSM 1257 / FGSC 987) TaxID=367110 RepID=Q7S8P9_NEUCR|nr:hypothetical protein NCU08654 [Neurospora crassa OR74A]EAA32719.1 hypothetical protein NCU08654 [Neurospora crassa OR74A]KHE82821.1 hypothetical protein GE21DRAFT_6324 [Neurospora crassa]|eukprot:XP_961955.1 hypothetical protein NCU08654 [Neurospora crassa OR74A]